VRYTWNPAKNVTNFAKHGVWFEAVFQFDWITAMTETDRRRDYGEPRFRSLGMIDGQVFVLIHTPRGELIRVISLRRANRKEIVRYDAATH
jgi:uncharacterized protein